MRLLDDHTVKDKDGNEIRWRQTHYVGLKPGEIGLARAVEGQTALDAWRGKHTKQGADRPLTLSDHRGVLMHLRGKEHTKPNWKRIMRKHPRQSDRSYEADIEKEDQETPGRRETQ